MARNIAFCSALALIAAVPSTQALAGSISPYAAINAAAAADPVEAKPLRGAVVMLSGSGGNIGVLAGHDGLLLVDAGIAVSQAKIETALRNIGKGPVRFVVNTHWHWDHTDGNAWLHRAGATIIASRHTAKHLNETIRVEEWGHTFTPVSPDGRPTDIVMQERQIRFGDETISIRPYDPGHTDGDIAVYFQKADILQTGDTFWNGMYPFIDYVGGGSINGSIRSAQLNLERAGPGTIIIPGHGPAGNRVQLEAFRDMLVAVRDRVAALKAQGKTEDQAVAAHPTEAFDGEWGQAVISGELFTRLVYRGVWLAGCRTGTAIRLP